MNAISCAILIGLGLVLGSSRVAADAKDEAKRHFERALELVDEGLFEEATVEFRRAYELSPHYAVLYDLGQAYVGLGRPVEAVDAFTRYLAEGGSEITPARRAQVEAEIRRQQTRIARVTIEVRPAGALITVDGQDVGRAPLGGPVRVGVGTHRVVVSHEGYLPLEQTLTVAGEQERTMVFELKPIAPRQSNGWLRFECRVPDLVVVFDGQSIGTTPILAPVLVPTGGHHVDFSRPGYTAARTEVTVIEGTTQAVDCAAQPMARLPPELAARLTVHPSEKEAQVMVDGAPFSSPGTLPAGRHVVTVTKAGFDSWQREVVLSPGTNPDLVARLVPQQAYRTRFEARAQERRNWAWATGAAGLAVGVASVVLFVWNDQRYSDWKERPRKDLETSIKTVDLVNLALGITAGALLVTGGVLYLTGDDPDRYRTPTHATPSGRSLTHQIVF